MLAGDRQVSGEVGRSGELWEGCTEYQQDPVCPRREGWHQSLPSLPERRQVGLGDVIF